MWGALWGLARWLWGLPSTIYGTLRHLWRYRHLYLPLGLAGGLLLKWVWDDPQRRLVGPLGRGWTRLWSGSGGVSPSSPPTSGTAEGPPPTTAPSAPLTRNSLRIRGLLGLWDWYTKHGANYPLCP